MHKFLPGVVQAIGGVIVALGFAVIYRPLGVIVAGALAILFGVALERSDG